MKTAATGTSVQPHALQPLRLTATHDNLGAEAFGEFQYPTPPLGSSASGFRNEVESEQQLARLEHFLDQYEDFKDGVRMPPRLASEFTRIRDELGDFPGRTVDAARLRAMLANPARTYYPGVLNDCYFEASTALCLSRRPSAGPDTEPVMNHCQPAKCPNSCVLPQHRPAIDNVIGDAKQLLAIRPISALQRAALQEQIERMRRMRAQAEQEEIW